MFGAYVWVLIPLAGIALAAFSEYLKFKKQTAKLGSSTALLEGEFAALREEIKSLKEERGGLVKRLQNLEAIVTSEAWETLGTDRELARAKTPQLTIPEPEEQEVSDQEQAAKMARRLRH